MGAIGNCCCNCLCPEAFEFESASVNWLSKNLSVDFPVGSPGVDVCDRTAAVCDVDSSWALWHDETVLGPWSIGATLGSGSCNCAGTYSTQTIRIDTQIIFRFKMWYKRRWVITASLQHCGNGQSKVRIIAGLQYLWLWNSTTKQRRRYTITTRSCPSNTLVTDPEVVVGSDDGHEPGFPPLTDAFNQQSQCSEVNWTEDQTCNDGDTSETISITSRFVSCIEETRSYDVGVDTACSNCASILNPNGGARAVVSGAFYTYDSECFPCNEIPEEVEVSIPGATVDPTWTVYGSAFTLGLCDWLTSFPASPVITIPRTLSVTLIT